jgi:hypothetical protein
MRYLVRDEDGEPLRKFWSQEDALRFSLPGYTIEKLPAPPKPPPIDMVALYGEALF